MEDEGFNATCEKCGGDRFEQEDDGHYYCTICCFQSQDIIETGVADEDFAQTGAEGAGLLYLSTHKRRQPARPPVIKAEPISQFMPDGGVKREDGMGEEFGGPMDFGLPMDYNVDDQTRYTYTYNEVRLRYVMGLQIMLAMQCKALVESFGVNPLVCGFASSIWLRFVAASGVFGDGWADNAMSESEARKTGIPDDVDHPPRYNREIRNSHGERAVLIWYRSLRNMIPLPSSLVVSFLACHVARESVLPTDILKWTLEGKLPYLAAFIEIEKKFVRRSSVCSLSASFMFRPSEVVPVQKLEAMAAQVADTVGLDLPPVNFHAIAARYLNQLSLPIERILQHGDRIVDWSMPAELWLSANELRLPTRVYVMAVLIVSIRILYNIHGFGVWEKYISSHERTFGSNAPSQPSSNCQSSSFSVGTSPLKSNGVSMQEKDTSLDSGELLCNLEATYVELQDKYEYSKDLPTYLNYCKNIIFAGTVSNDYEKKMADDFWDIYQDEQGQNEECRTPYSGMPKGKATRHCDTPYDGYSRDSKRTAYSDDVPGLSVHGLDDQSEQSHSYDRGVPHKNKNPSSLATGHQASTKCKKEETINRLKADMEENRFCYIPPRVNVKRHDYLYYVRKKDEGAYTYVAHADYYILLRACARVAQVDIRLMHMGVQNFERRLAWIEKRIDHCLNFTSLDAESGSDDGNLSDTQRECCD